MKKIIYILVALGLVLGLTVVATPAAANVSNITVVANPNVECSCSNLTVKFTTTLALSQYQKVYVRFPAGSTLGVCGTPAVSLDWYNPLTMSWVTGIVTTATPTIIKYGDGTTQMHVTIGTTDLPAGQCRLVINNVVAMPKAGTYTLKVSTEREPTEVASASFTVLAGPTLKQTSALWCGPGSCMTVYTEIDLGTFCTNCIKNVVYTTAAGGVVLPPANYTVSVIDAVTWNLTINCGNMSALNPQVCQPAWFTIEFCYGCNATLSLTVAQSAAVPLHNGWNLISLPLIPISTDINVVLGALFNTLGPTWQDQILAVWYYDCGSWYVYKNGTGFDSLTTMEAGKSYWICMNMTGGTPVLPVCGFEFPCPPAVPPKYCYHECWNMVGFKSTNTTMNAANYTASVPAGGISGILTFDSTGWHIVSQDSGSTQYMVPGQGYWMAFSADACIVPPII